MFEINNNSAIPGISKLPPPGSPEFDREMSQRRIAQEKRYKETSAPYSAQPQLFAKDVPPPKLSGIGADFDRFFDWLGEQFWGNEEKKTDKNDTPNTPVNPTPKLPSPKFQEWSKANMHELLKALDEMKRWLVQIQDISKDEICEATSVDEARALYAFIALLKQSGEIKKDAQVLNHQGIALNHDKMRSDQEARNALQTALEKSESAAAIAGTVSTVSGFLLAAASVIQILKFAGYFSVVGAPPAAVAELITIAIFGLASVAKTLETKCNLESIKQKTDIMTLNHKSENFYIPENKDFSHDISFTNSSIIKLISEEARQLQNYNRMLEHARTLGG